MRKTIRVGGLLVLMAVSGCSDVSNVLGLPEDILVATDPKANAVCNVTSAQGSWAIAATPATINIARAASPLTVSCQTIDGWSGTQTVNPIGGATYPDQIVVTLALPNAEPRPAYGADGGRMIAPPRDPVADRERQREDNVITRFQALRVLLDEGLITNEEYNIRRGANLGALLRYGVVPGGRDLERASPPPSQVVARLRYLAAAYVEHSITAAEQAAERGVILEGLLPAHLQRRADPPPPIRDQLQLAAEIGRIERMRLANVITEKESAAEKAKVSQLLDASIAADDAAARMAAGVPVARSALGGMPGMTGVGVALSTHSSESQARKIWAGLQKVYPTELGTLQMSLKKIPRPHRPSHYRITAGPLADKDAAVGLCRILKRRGVACQPTKLGE